MSGEVESHPRVYIDTNLKVYEKGFYYSSINLGVWSDVLGRIDITWTLF